MVSGFLSRFDYSQGLREVLHQLMRLPCERILDYGLTAAELVQLQEVGTDLASNGLSSEGEFASKWHEWILNLPGRIHHALIDFRRNETALGLVLRSLPIPFVQNRPTPLSYSAPDEAPLDPDVAVFGLLATVLGEPIGFTTQQHGHLFNDIIPMAQNADVPNISSGSMHEFQLHTEDAFHQFVPDYFCLLCIRNPDRVPVNLSGVNVNELDDQYVERLRRDRFLVAPNPLQEVEVREPEPKSILWGSNSDPYMRVNTALLDGATRDPEDRDALLALTEHLHRNMFQVTLQPGDALFLDNFRAVHGRSPYSPRFDGTDRWMKRLVVSIDVRKSREFRSSALSRILDPARPGVIAERSN